MAKIKRRISVALGICCAGLFIASCTQGGDIENPGQETISGAGLPVESEPVTSSGMRRTQIVDPVWSIKIKALAQPQTANGVVVVLAQGKDSPELVGLTESTGKRLWNAPAARGMIPTGMSMGVDLSKTSNGKDVVLLLKKSKPRDGWGGTVWAKPVALDVQTGKSVYEGPAQVIQSFPSQCPDEKDMCYTSINPHTNGSQRMRVDLSKGIQRTLIPHHEIKDTIFPISGGELYGHYRGKTAHLLKLDGDNKSWEVPLAKAMGKKYSTSRGWDIDYSSALGVYSGSIGQKFTTKKDKNGKVVARDWDFTQDKMIGLDAENGKVLWSAIGANRACLAPMETHNTVLENGRSYPVRCIYESGAVHFGAADTGKLENERVRLEGFDPVTGKVIWKTQTYSPKPEEDIELAQAPADGGSTLLLSVEKKPTILDTRTGETMEVGPDERFLCSKSAHYEEPEEANAGTLLFPCTASGKKAVGTSAGALEMLNRQGKYAVVGYADAVAAYPVERPAGM